MERAKAYNGRSTVRQTLLCVIPKTRAGSPFPLNGVYTRGVYSSLPRSTAGLGSFHVQKRDSRSIPVLSNQASTLLREASEIHQTRPQGQPAIQQYLLIGKGWKGGWGGSPLRLALIVCLSAAATTEALLPSLLRPALLPTRRPTLLCLLCLVLYSGASWLWLCLLRLGRLGCFSLSDARHQSLSLLLAVGATLSIRDVGIRSNDHLKLATF